MQSFFIPALGSQIYAMGGMVTQLNLQATRPGRSLGENTMYNGDGFSQEKFSAVALPPEKFKAWMKMAATHGDRFDARTLQIISQRSTKSQLIGALPRNDSKNGNVYLTGVSANVFPAVVRSTMNGTPVQLPHAGQMAMNSLSKSAPMNAVRERQR